MVVVREGGEGRWIMEGGDSLMVDLDSTDCS